MVKLKRLKIQKFRNVAPGTELRFRDSLNVLLGKNGTGKTTLLNLVVSLLRWDFSSLIKEPLEIEYDLEAPEGQVTIRLRNEPRSSVLRLSPDGQSAALGFLAGTLFPSGRDYETLGEIVVSGDKLEMTYTVAINGSTAVLRTPREELRSHSLNRPILDDNTIENLLIAISNITKGIPTLTNILFSLMLLGDTLTLKRYDESLEYLNQITEDEEAFNALGFPSEERTVYAAIPRHGGPKEILTEITHQLNQTPDVDEIRVQTEDTSAAFLEKAVRLLGFESAKVRVQRTSRSTEEPQERIAFGNIRFDFERRDRSIINHHLLS